MSHTIVEGSGLTWDDTLTMPDNTEIADAAFLEDLLKKLASRTKYLRNSSEGIGVRTLRVVSSLDDLRDVPVAGLINGEFRHVSGSDWLGLYKYVFAATGSEEAPYFIAPNGGGAGRWVHDRYYHGVIDTKHVNAAPAYVNGGAVADVTGSALTFAVHAGDEIEIEASGLAHVSGSGGYVALAVIDPSGSTLVSENPADAGFVTYGGLGGISGTVTDRFHIAKTYAFLGDGTATVKLRALNINQPADSITVSSYTLRARLVRP